MSWVEREEEKEQGMFCAASLGSKMASYDCLLCRSFIAEVECGRNAFPCSWVFSVLFFKTAIELLRTGKGFLSDCPVRRNGKEWVTFCFWQQQQEERRKGGFPCMEVVSQLLGLSDCLLPPPSQEVQGEWFSGIHSLFFDFCLLPHHPSTNSEPDTIIYKLDF